MTTAWSGDWYARVKERVRARGYETATEFAEAQPTESLLVLADQLGKEDVAAKQLENVLIDEADDAGLLERCARGLLVRRIREKLPEGWHAVWDESELGSAFRRASALSRWGAAFGTQYDPAIDRVCDALLALPIPEGWLPEGPDDPYIAQAFEHWRDPA